MRRRLFLIAAAVAVVLPAAASPREQAKGRALRIAMALPGEGNANTSLVELPLVLKRGRTPKLRVVVRAEKPLPPNVIATYRVVRKGARLYVGPSFVLPHVLERSGTLSNAATTFDTTLFTTYTSGLVGADRTHDVPLDIFLFDNGKPVDLSTAVPCATCSFALAGGRKQLLRIDNLLTPSHPVPPAGFCKLGFGVIAVSGGGDDVDLQGFVVNSHTSAFDLSVFGFTPAPIAASIESGVSDAGCGVSSAAADAVTAYARPAAQGFTLTVDATHHHGAGSSNLCVRVRTSPPQSGSASISLAGPSGAGTKTVALGADGSATAVFGITQYGNYTGSATVGSKSGGVSYTVDAGAGQAFSCPGP